MDKSVDKGVSKVRWFNSIRFKLALSYILICFVPLLFFYLTVLVSIENYYVSDRQSRLRTAADIESNHLSRMNYLANLNEPAAHILHNNYIATRAQEGGYRIMVFDDRLMNIFDTNRNQDGNTIVRPEVITALLSHNEIGLEREEGEEVIFAAAAIIDEYGRRAGAVLLAESARDIFESLEFIRQSILLYTMLAIMFVCILVLFFSSRLLIEPLKGILRVVQRMAEGHLDQRIPVGGHDEYSQLADAFNNMTEKLEQVEKAREEFVSNVSHELKTPLTSMKVLSESILLQDPGTPEETYREFLQDVTSEVDRMTLIVNDLLELVKLDRRDYDFQIAAIKLNELVEDTLKRLSPLAEQKKIALLYEDVRQVTLDADEIKLGLAISNIVENGIKYTHSGGTVKVTVDADHQNAFITIQDTGIGIPEEEQSKVFNRFYRVDKNRDRDTGGTGLGLAISHSVVLMHHGSLRLTSKPEEGSTFVIRLPIRRA